jgi:hypothetical protein
MKDLISWLVVAAVMFCLIILVLWVISASPEVQAALNGGGVKVFLSLLSGS